MSAIGDQNIIIRPAKQDDLDTIFIMIIKLSDYQKLAKPEMSLASFRRDSGLVGGRKYFELLVIENTNNKQLDYFIEPEYRGTGIGRKLFVEVAATALKSNCKGIVLRALKWNPAVTVYERFGGRKTADISGVWWQFTFDESTLQDLVNSK